jgi:uncharacterized membrane protein
LRSIATAKPTFFTKQGLASNPKPEPTKVVAGHSPQCEWHAHDEAASASFPPASSELPPEERALWEAAIQLDLVAVNTAEAQVAQGRTVAAWMAGLEPDAGGDRKDHPTAFDRALLLALVMLNLLVLVALAAAIVWVFRPFI